MKRREKYFRVFVASLLLVMGSDVLCDVENSKKVVVDTAVKESNVSVSRKPTIKAPAKINEVSAGTPKKKENVDDHKQHAAQPAHYKNQAGRHGKGKGYKRPKRHPRRRKGGKAKHNHKKIHAMVARIKAGKHRIKHNKQKHSSNPALAGNAVFKPMHHKDKQSGNSAGNGKHENKRAKSGKEASHKGKQSEKGVDKGKHENKPAAHDKEAHHENKGLGADKKAH